MVRPKDWLDFADFYKDKQDEYMDWPNIEYDDNKPDRLERDLGPADTVIFKYKTIAIITCNKTVDAPY